MYSSIFTLFKLFFSICRLRIGPQDIPASAPFTVVLLLAYTLISILVSLNLLPLDYSIFASLLETTLTVALTLGILQLRRLENRSMQTLSALAGTGIVISVIELPVIYWLGLARATDMDPSLPGIFMLFLLAWSLMIMAHILRHALNIHFFFGFLLSLFYYWAYLSVVGTVLRPATS
jgi:hypothetical protein